MKKLTRGECRYIVFRKTEADSAFAEHFLCETAREAVLKIEVDLIGAGRDGYKKVEYVVYKNIASGGDSGMDDIYKLYPLPEAKEEPSGTEDAATGG
jgi:hypothetical protein